MRNIQDEAQHVHPALPGMNYELTRHRHIAGMLPLMMLITMATSIMASRLSS